MTQTVSVDIKIAKDLVFAIRELKEEVVRLRKRVEAEPSYGSNQWWEWSNDKALQEVREKKGTVLHNKKELKEFFQSLRDA